MLSKKSRTDIISESVAIGNILLGASVGSIITIGLYIYIRKTEWDDFDKYIEYATIAISFGALLLTASWIFRRILLKRLFGVTDTDVSESIDNIGSKLKDGDLKGLAVGIKDLYFIWSAIQLRWKIITILVVLMGNVFLAANAAMLVKQTKVLSEELNRKKINTFFEIDERLSTNENFIQIYAYTLFPAQREKIRLPSDMEVNKYIFWLNRMGTLTETDVIQANLVVRYYKATIKAFFSTPKFCSDYSTNARIAPDSIEGLKYLGDRLAKEEIERCLSTH